MFTKYRAKNVRAVVHRHRQNTDRLASQRRRPSCPSRRHGGRRSPKFETHRIISRAGGDIQTGKGGIFKHSPPWEAPLFIVKMPLMVLNLIYIIQGGCVKNRNTQKQNKCIEKTYRQKNKEIHMTYYSNNGDNK